MKTIKEIKQANKAIGGHWFDKGTLRFFNSRIYPEVYKGADGMDYFITSERFDEKHPRKYTIRRAHSGEIDTVGELRQYDTKADAIKAVKRIVNGEFCVNCGEPTKDIPRDYTVEDNHSYSFPYGKYKCNTCEEIEYFEVHLEGDLYCYEHGFENCDESVCESAKQFDRGAKKWQSEQKN